MTQTIHQVNREALAAKLAKMGIHPGATFLENHATVAVEEFLAAHGGGGEPEVTVTGFEATGEVETDVDCICPQCGQKFTMDDVSVDVSLDVEEDEIKDAVEVVGHADARPGMLVLDPSEVTLILMDWVKSRG
jgi:hypothetical protein